ncbi:MAG TPA: DUF1611 domain-containing protein [Caldithrix abyssi]|uniref:DUF1611 domain-containing protein n=1 Tax=Caldithrix abyssi TaxID=187145 RepID=A0A7V1LPN9_CALAY|nr:DUF1611 domain-containing protein [Caldithrix abyssi]
MKRRIVIHADKPLKLAGSKLEEDLLHYLSDEIIGVIDPKNAGKTTQQVLNCGGDIPITSSFDELIEYKPNYLLLGASSFRGEFPMEWYPMVIKALQMRVHILNGLHQPLNKIVEFELLSQKYKAKIYDLRHPGEKPLKFKGRVDALQSKRLFFASLNSGGVELPSMMESLKALHRQGISADWIPTGMASNLIKGKGFIAESLVSDLISGYLEGKIAELDQKFQYIFIEGQGYLRDPLRAGAFVSLLHGARPDGIMLTAGLKNSKGRDELVATVRDFQHLLRHIKKAPFVGLAFYAPLLKESEKKEISETLQEELVMPVFDPYEGIPNKVVERIKNIAKS